MMMMNHFSRNGVQQFYYLWLLPCATLLGRSAATVPIRPEISMAVLCSLYVCMNYPVHVDNDDDALNIHPLPELSCYSGNSRRVDDQQTVRRRNREMPQHYWPRSVLVLNPRSGKCGIRYSYFNNTFKKKKVCIKIRCYKSTQWKPID